MSSPSERSSLEGLLEECREDDCNFSETLPAHITPYSASRSAIRNSSKFVILHACLILLYTGGSILAVWVLTQRRMSISAAILCDHDSTVHHEGFANNSIAPAREAVIDKAQYFDIVNPQDSKYVREPSPEVDEAWNNILQRQSANSLWNEYETDSLQSQTRTSAFQRQ